MRVRYVLLPVPQGSRAPRWHCGIVRQPFRWAMLERKVSDCDSGKCETRQVETVVFYDSGVNIRHTDQAICKRISRYDFCESVVICGVLLFGWKV